MKLLATVAIASSVAMASPTWCTNPGQGCWKREAAPLPEPAPEADPTWCTNPGQGCWKAKREAEAVPEPEAEAVPTWCTNPGQGCWKRDAAPVPEPVPEADPTWCTNPGQGCWKAKRDAEAEPQWHFPTGCWKTKRDASAAPEPWAVAYKSKREAEAEAVPEPFATAWCMNPGQGCWKVKRAIDAFVDGVLGRSLPVDADASRGWPSIQIGSHPAFNSFASYVARIGGAHEDPENENNKCFVLGGCVQPNVTLSATQKAKREADPTWCTNPGQGCWKKKRSDISSDDIKDITRDVLAAVGEDVETPEEKRWCIYPGQGCWKAKRDLATIREFAREILEAQ
ncbi:Clock-controlled pheromone ccg-4 [Escovopsis weberi]|uniref:Clock-controlled pheromone ccg-4 n=1 Tax=Escovopsis weberi TaxID=150374 RepID=A0A0M8N1D4_ESCWE|nr:Clock-controlled pheromone ccg-4 [Escovopsis weberi]